MGSGVQTNGGIINSGHQCGLEEEWAFDCVEVSREGPKALWVARSDDIPGFSVKAGPLRKEIRHHAASSGSGNQRPAHGHLGSAVQCISQALE